MIPLLYHDISLKRIYCAKTKGFHDNLTAELWRNSQPSPSPYWWLLLPPTDKPMAGLALEGLWHWNLPGKIRRWGPGWSCLGQEDGEFWRTFAILGKAKKYVRHRSGGGCGRCHRERDSIKKMELLTETWVFYRVYCWWRNWWKSYLWAAGARDNLLEKHVVGDRQSAPWLKCYHWDTCHTPSQSHLPLPSPTLKEPEPTKRVAEERKNRGGNESSS